MFRVPILLPRSSLLLRSDLVCLLGLNIGSVPSPLVSCILRISCHFIYVIILDSQIIFFLLKK